MFWLKKLAAGVGAFLTQWAGHPRRIRGTVEHIYSSGYGRITCRRGQFPFRIADNPNEPVLKQGDSVEFESDRLWSVEDLVALWEAYEQRRAERAA